MISQKILVIQAQERASRNITSVKIIINKSRKILTFPPSGEGGRGASQTMGMGGGGEYMGEFIER